MVAPHLERTSDGCRAATRSPSAGPAPPAKGGRTSIVPPAASRTVAGSRLLTGVPSTTNAHLASTRAKSAPCAAVAAASACSRVSATYGSSEQPAASRAAAQYRISPVGGSETPRLPAFTSPKPDGNTHTRILGSVRWLAERVPWPATPSASRGVAPILAKFFVRGGRREHPAVADQRLAAVI
jgi:hypothetical protein